MSQIEKPMTDARPHSADGEAVAPDDRRRIELDACLLPGRADSRRLLLAWFVKKSFWWMFFGGTAVASVVHFVERVDNEFQVNYRSPESVEHGLLSAWVFVVLACQRERERQCHPRHGDPQDHREHDEHPGRQQPVLDRLGRLVVDPEVVLDSLDEVHEAREGGPAEEHPPERLLHEPGLEQAAAIGATGLETCVQLDAQRDTARCVPRRLGRVT